jgi:hypothetical protein
LLRVLPRFVYRAPLLPVGAPLAGAPALTVAGSRRRLRSHRDWRNTLPMSIDSASTIGLMAS